MSLYQTLFYEGLSKDEKRKMDDISLGTKNHKHNGDDQSKMADIVVIGQMAVWEESVQLEAGSNSRDADKLVGGGGGVGAPERVDAPRLAAAGVSVRHPNKQPWRPSSICAHGRIFRAD